jgi:hypothetical protein
VSPTQIALLARNCQIGFHSHVAQPQPQPPLRGPLLLRWEGKHKFSTNVLISMTSKEGWRPLTFFLRPAATSTVGIELLLNKLKFQRRGSSGIDCGALGRVLKRKESRQRWANDGRAGEAVERGSVLVSASQKSLPYTYVRIARARNERLHLHISPSLPAAWRPD